MTSGGDLERRVGNQNVADYGFDSQTGNASSSDTLGLFPLGANILLAGVAQPDERLVNNAPKNMSVETGAI